MYIINKIVLKILKITKLSNLLSDKSYIKMDYYNLTKSKINLENPKTFNEKLNWLKLNDRNPIYTTMVDKYEAKKYAANIIGKEYIIPTIDIYNEFDEINFDKLPNKFVIKCTHDSGGLIVCKDKSKLDINEARKKINKSLKNNYYYTAREWPYKNVKPRILIEQYMEDEKTHELRDYKFYCSYGKVHSVMVCIDRNTKNTKYQQFDLNWRKLDYIYEEYTPNKQKKIIKPKNFDKMIKIAEKLSENLIFVRIDLYNANEKIYFGEYTFYPSAGFDTEYNNKALNELGDFIDLSKVKEK